MKNRGNAVDSVQSRDRLGADSSARIPQTVEPQKHPLPHGRGSVRSGRRSAHVIHEYYRLISVRLNMLTYSVPSTDRAALAFQRRDAWVADEGRATQSTTAIDNPSNHRTQGDSL